MRPHLLKKLILPELLRMFCDLYGIDFETCQTFDRRRYGLDSLFAKENT